MNMEVRQPRRRAQKTRTASSTATSIRSARLKTRKPYLSNRWWDHLQTYGARPRHGFAKGLSDAEDQPQAARRDAWPPGGGLPGSDLDFMREQHLDLYDIDYGIMNPLSPTGQGDQNPEFSAAMAFAVERVAARTLDARASSG